jgi:hypothetical protein
VDRFCTQLDCVCFGFCFGARLVIDIDGFNFQLSCRHLDAGTPKRVPVWTGPYPIAFAQRDLELKMLEAIPHQISKTLT